MNVQILQEEVNMLTSKECFWEFNNDRRPDLNKSDY